MTNNKHPRETLEGLAKGWATWNGPEHDPDKYKELSRVTLEALDAHGNLADLRAKLAAATERAEKAELAVQEQRLLTETVRAGMQSLGRALEDCRLDKHAVEVKLAEANFAANKAEAQLAAAFADLRREQNVTTELRKCVTGAIARAEAAEAERDQVMDLILRAEGIGSDGELGISAEKVHELFHSEQQLTTARAGEARALEALRKIAEDATTDVQAVDGVPGSEAMLCYLCGQLDDHNEGCPALAFGELDAHPALDWLAEQRREAVAEWLEKEAQTNMKQIGEYYERSAAGMLKQAAELRKGKGE